MTTRIHILQKETKIYKTYNHKRNLKEYVAFLFMDCLVLKVGALPSFEMSVNVSL